MRPFWRRPQGKGRAWTAIFQRAYDGFAEVLTFKTSPGQPRYYDNNGNAIATVAVLNGGERAWDVGVQEDNSTGTFTDDTVDLNDADANDVAPFPAGAGLDDAFYFGSKVRFAQMTITVGTAGIGTYTVPAANWEYWNGSAWTSLSGLTDNTTSFKTAGTNTVVFTLPTDWATTTLTITASGDETVPAYFIRARRDGGTVTTDPLLTSAVADNPAVPDGSQEPTFEGAAYAGNVRILWEGDTFTVDYEVYARIDSTVRTDADGSVIFTGTYVLIHTQSTQAHLAEVNVENAYRPIFVRPTASTGDGTLRIAPI